MTGSATSVYSSTSGPPCSLKMTAFMFLIFERRPVPGLVLYERRNLNAEDAKFVRNGRKGGSPLRPLRAFPSRPWRLNLLFPLRSTPRCQSYRLIALSHWRLRLLPRMIRRARQRARFDVTESQLHADLTKARELFRRDVAFDRQPPRVRL